MLFAGISKDMELNSRGAVWNMTIETGDAELWKFHPALLAIQTTPLEALMALRHPNQYHTVTLAEEGFLLVPGMELGIQWDQRVMLSGSASCVECRLCSSSQPHRQNSLNWCPRRHQEHAPQAI